MHESPRLLPIQPHLRERPGILSSCWRHSYTLLAILLVFVTAIPFLLKRESEWDDVYVLAASHLWHGQDIYAPKDAYMYPPAMAFLALPFSWVPAPVSRLLWFAVSAAALLFLVHAAWRLAGGRSLRDARRVPRREHFIFVIGLASGIRYGVDCLSHQQTDLLIGLAILGGCWALARERPLFAAVSIGIGAAIKCTPLLWCSYLLGRGRWQAALVLAMVALGLNFAPDFIQAPPQGGTWAQNWVQRVLPRAYATGAYPGDWYSDSLYNQSLAGAGFRWFVTQWQVSESGFQMTDRSRPILSPLALKYLLYTVELLLVSAAGLVLARRPPERESHPAVPRASLEFSSVVLLMVLLSPMSSKPHFCTLVLPGFCLARAAYARNDRWLWSILVLAVGLGTLGVKGLAGGTIAPLALWYGTVTWSACLMLLACGYCLLRSEVASASAPPTILALRRAA